MKPFSETSVVWKCFCIKKMIVDLVSVGYKGVVGCSSVVSTIKRWNQTAFLGRIWWSRYKHNNELYFFLTFKSRNLNVKHWMVWSIAFTGTIVAPLFILFTDFVIKAFSACQMIVWLLCFCSFFDYSEVYYK